MNLYIDGLIFEFVTKHSLAIFLCFVLFIGLCRYYYKNHTMATVLAMLVWGCFYLIVFYLFSSFSKMWTPPHTIWGGALFTNHQKHRHRPKNPLRILQNHPRTNANYFLLPSTELTFPRPWRRGTRLKRHNRALSQAR